MHLTTLSFFVEQTTNTSSLIIQLVVEKVLGVKDLSQTKPWDSRESGEPWDSRKSGEAWESGESGESGEPWDSRESGEA